MTCARHIAVVLLAISCTPAPAPQAPVAPHPYFPVAEGDTHALGRTSETGPIACESCHLPTFSNRTQFSCFGCHEETVTGVRHTVRQVAGYRYDSRACFGCHGPGAFAHEQTVQVTGLVPRWQGTSIVATTPFEQALPMTMNHGSAQIPVAASVCASCHRDIGLGVFYGGQFHPTLLDLGSAQPGACSDCHASAAPVGFVGPVNPDAGRTRDPATGAMNHHAQTLDGGAIVTEDCAVCHVAPSVSSHAAWSTSASFHRAREDGGVAQPASCLECHANTRPQSDAGLTLAGGGEINHQTPVWLGDCVDCHTTTGWRGGRFHLSGMPPASCLPCHEGRRPVSTTGWQHSVVRDAPFDYVTNERGIGHGGGLDCAVCHSLTATWTDAGFTHSPTSLAATTCISCHTTQRQNDGGFDHTGSGDCFGCHQQSVTTPHDSIDDWAGGQGYPGANLISSSDRFVRVSSLALRRSGPNNLVTGTSSTTVTLYNAMLHTSAQLPPELNAGGGLGDMTKCWHCHDVPFFRDAGFHSALDGFRLTPDAGITPQPQPATCNECHVGMRPPGIVQSTSLRPMDHSTVTQLDCSRCHHEPGGKWDAGTLHPNVDAGISDCVTCHYPLLADSAKADVISAASPGPYYRMQHRSPQLTTQKCDACHGTALANALGAATAAQWRPAAFHPNVTPTACFECHRNNSEPTHPNQSPVAYQGDGQWMDHLVPAVVARDCAFCHAADSPPPATTWTTWSRSTVLHRPGFVATGCNGCHGPNAPPALKDTSTVTTASASTGKSGQHDQILHSDANVAARDCKLCHTQTGVADAGSPISGREWAQADFHVHFTGSVALGSRCSTCHLNLKPDPSYPEQDHSSFGATGQDCGSCHAWPGTGSATAPNWQRPGAAPSTLTVGGFAIAMPPATVSTAQAGLNNLAHPAVPTGGACTGCHAQASGGRRAFAYDHALAPSTGCAACHEAGSDLVGTPWTANAPGAAQLGANCNMGGGTVADRGGDTRPVGLASLACSSGAASQTCGGATCVSNHFYPADCGECHRKPTAAPATTQTGAAYVSNWKFVHSFGAPIQQATCCKCHSSRCP